MEQIPFLDSQYLIYEGQHWNVILHRDNQSYLGRSIVYLKSRVLENPLEITQAERDEFWNEIMPKLAAALQKSFRPDRLNYAHLANKDHFVHWHVIPRYEKNPVREFAGETFTDERVGRNCFPEPTKATSQEVTEKICAEIKKNF